MPWSAEFFEEVSEDRHHGASAVFGKFLSLIHTYLQQLENLDSEFVASLPSCIIGTRPDMAPFYYAAMRLTAKLGKLSTQSDTIREELEQFIRELQTEQSEARDKILGNAGGALGDVKAVMLHSNSHTVTAIARELLDREVKLFVSDAYPDKEGEQVAHELAGTGFEVTLIPDDAKCQYVSQVDLVLLGSDWVAESDFTNKIGSQSVVLAASNNGKKVVVATDAGKIVPGKFRPKRRPNRIRLSKNLYREAPLFEEVDNSLVDLFVTDLGLFTPAELRDSLENRFSDTNFDFLPRNN